ncbi:ABC transporter substrate-binding protein [Mycolicibacterium bacteremicum]|uniref:ABC transporter substrate-binding protein n=1 Tax=Mycolicibacterium bacteremicum TaxID=564198 RepID=UPI0026EAC662|nr:ABC transporter substrate-binding protein [Mycolicibacterium bacteremicum]
MIRTPRFAIVAAILTLLLAACGSGDRQPAAGDAWSFTSGDGKTYTAEQVPSRIIAQGEAAAALMSFGIRPVGVYLNAPLEETRALDGLNLDGIEIIGDTWGQIDVEKAAALRPDLIVSAYWPVEEAYGGFEEGVEENSKKAARLAPVVGPTIGESVEDMLNGFETLAVSLGADVNTSEIAGHKADFAAARDRFAAATAAKPELTALAVSPTDELLYVAVPENSAELTDFAEWGLDLIVPDNPDPAFPYWENLSWENADKYQPDLILMDDRTYDASLAIADRQATWKRIKAVEAGAVTPWPAYWISTWSAYADQLDQLSDAVEKANPGLT